MLSVDTYYFRRNITFFRIRLDKTNNIVQKCGLNLNKVQKRWEEVRRNIEYLFRLILVFTEFFKLLIIYLFDPKLIKLFDPKLNHTIANLALHIDASIFTKNQNVDKSNIWQCKMEFNDSCYCNHVLSWSSTSKVIKHHPQCIGPH